MKHTQRSIASAALIITSVITTNILNPTLAQNTRRPSDAASQTRNEQGGCTTRYDRFRNRNTTVLEPRTIMTSGTEELRLGFSAIAEGEATAPREIEWNFDSTTERLLYGNKAEVRFIVDGRRINGGTAYRSGGYAMRQFNEKLKLTMPAARFLEIMAGREVEMQLGETEVRLRSEDLQKMRDFASCVRLQPVGEGSDRQKSKN